MGETTVAVWTAQEQTIARHAFDAAQSRAVASLIATVQTQAARVTSVDSLWHLHDYLSIQRHGLEGRFDFRLDGILFVFARLVKDGLLGLDELDGLDPEKLAKIAAMARF